jgi:hypothetical protein
MAQEISFDDLIPATKERVAATPAVSSTAPVTSSNEISFDDLLPTESEQPKIPTTSLGSFGAAAGEGAVTARGAIAGARAAMAVTPPILPFVGPFAKPTAGIVGGVGGAILANYGIKNIYQLADNVFGTNIEATREAQQRQNPIATKSGFIAGGSLNPWMRPMLPKTVAGAAGMGAVGLGVGAGVRALQGEKVLDPKEMAIDAVTGAFVGPTARGRAALGLPPESKAPVSKEAELPTKPPEGSTPEQKQAFIDKLKTIVSEKEAKIPLVETAIRNKETGEIELMGPKHNEQRKLETIDTHDQGFITEDNRFLDRKQAFEQAKRSGQIPEGQNPTDISIGLRSEDLRVAGDERFKLPEIPNVVEGIPTFKTDKIVRTDTGEKIGAKTRRDSSTGAPLRIDVDVDFLYQQFNDKPWTKPKVEGVFPIAENAFKTPQEWIDFVIQHEAEHVKTPKVEGQTKAQYENQTNKAALETLSKNKVSAPSKVIGSPDEPLVVDRTKTNPRDVKNEQEFNDIATDIYQKHGEVEAVKFFEGYQEYKKTFLEPIKETEKFVGINLQKKQANELIIHNNTNDIKTLAGKDVNLEQLSFDIDKGISLVGKAKEVADKFRTLMDELGKRALENGVIKGWHQDYVARNVVTEGAAPPTAIQEFITDVFGYKGGSGGAKTTTKYGQERRLESREDLVNHIEGLNSWLESQGENYRFKIKTNNLADIYKDYALSVEKAIENKNLIENLKQIRNVAGESLIKKIDNDNPLPYRWEQINHPDLAGYAIHPDLVPHLNFVFDSGPGRLMSALGNISQWTKFFNVIGSFFHAKSLMEVLSSAKIPIWTPLKEAIVLPLVEQGVKALTGKQLQLSAITKALDQMRKGGVGSNVDTWIKSELTFDMPEDVTKGILASLGKFTDSMIGKYGPKTRVLEKSLTTVEKYSLGAFNKYTWDYLHTGGKLFVADSYLNKARMQAAKEGKPFDEMAVRKEIARFVNEGFGGLNWYDIVRQTENEFAKRIALATYSPAGRRALQVILFAPDWTVSTIRAFTAALPKDLNPTKWQPVEGIKGMMTPTTRADYARLYQFKTALTYLTLYNAINMLTANRPIWENKDPTRIEYPDGTSMQAAKHAMEPYHWIMDPIKTLSNKLGFLPKAVIIGIAGTEYASPQAPKLVDPSASGRLKAAASGALPFQVQAAMSAPEGEGAKRALLGTLGFPVYGGTPEQKKTARAEREKILKENAARYRQKEKEAGR